MKRSSSTHNKGAEKMARARKRAKDEDGDEDESKEDDEVFRRGTAVYFQGEVNPSNISKLRSCLDEASKFALLYNNTLSKPEIVLYINSDGGCVFSGFSGFNVIRRSFVPVITVADGYIASAATFLLLGGLSRRIVPGSHVLIHQVSSDVAGTYQNIKDDAKNCAFIMAKMKGIYKTETSLTDKKLNKLLNRELDLTAEQCIKYGVVHSSL